MILLPRETLDSLITSVEAVIEERTILDEPDEGGEGPSVEPKALRPILKKLKQAKEERFKVAATLKRATRILKAEFPLDAETPSRLASLAEATDGKAEALVLSASLTKKERESLLDMCWRMPEGNEHIDRVAACLQFDDLESVGDLLRTSWSLPRAERELAAKLETSAQVMDASRC